LVESKSIRLDKKSVDAAEPKGTAYRLWDADLKGFGLKVMPSGVKTYCVTYRIGQGRAGVKREFTIGRHGEMTPKEARKAAADQLASVRLGGDPQSARAKERTELTVEQLCSLYMLEGVGTKKASTLVTDRSRIKSHIIPLLGRKPVSSITPSDVVKFVRDVAAGKTAVPVKPSRKTLRNSGVKGAALRAAPARTRHDPMAKGGKGAATRTTGLLGGIFEFAVREGYVTKNPVRGVERFKDKKSQRFLSVAEVQRLMTSLEAARDAGTNPNGFGVIYLLALTGARRSEIEGLMWSELDFDHSLIRLDDSKVGSRTIPLGTPALEFLRQQTRVGASLYVFPSSRNPDSYYVGTHKIWEQVRKDAGLDDVRMHDLRHTYASFAVAGGLSLPFIGALLGHKDTKTTAQYAHIADQPILDAATSTAGAIERAMYGK